MVSTESDEATPRDERYGDGGTNGVDENKFVRTAALTGGQSVICKADHVISAGR